MRQKQLALRCETDAAPVPYQDPEPELFFQSIEGTGKAGLAVAQFFCGLGQGTGLDGFQQRFILGYVHCLPPALPAGPAVCGRAGLTQTVRLPVKMTMPGFAPAGFFTLRTCT